MEQFVKKYEKMKSAPAGPGREIQVKPGDRDSGPIKPAANLPGIGRQEPVLHQESQGPGQDGP